MILVDSSVWIDYFNGNKTAQTGWLDSSQRTESCACGHCTPNTWTLAVLLRSGVKRCWHKLFS